MLRDIVLLFFPRTFHERNYRYFHVPYSLLTVAAALDRTRYELVLVDNNVLAEEDLTPLIRQHGGRLACVGISAMIGRQITDGLAFGRALRAYPLNNPG